MEPFIEKLRGVLHTEFANSRDELEPRPPRKVGGFLIWEGFSGLEQIERQRKVWEVLRERLNQEDQRRITAILTATPAEWAAMTETASEAHAPQGNHHA